MDPPGNLRRTSSLLLTYLFILIFFFSLFDCGTDFLIIRLRITRPVGEDDFLSCHSKQYCSYHVSFIRDVASSFYEVGSLLSVSPNSALRLHFDPLLDFSLTS